MSPVGHEILRTLVGSEVHGIALGTGDRDEMGIYIEPAEHVIGVRPALPHIVERTQPEGVRSGPGDTDRVHYSLRRFLSLAIKGNPTVLLPLFAPAESVVACTPLGAELRALAPAVLSQAAVHRFLGYMDGQRRRLTGARSGMPNRPELVEAYGYDVKFAGHALRLAYQGLELVRDGRLTLPMPATERERVLRVRRGEVRELAEVLAEVASVASTVEQLLASGQTPLPAAPDLDRVSAWSVHAHLSAWQAVAEI